MSPSVRAAGHDRTGERHFPRVDTFAREHAICDLTQVVHSPLHKDDFHDVSALQENVLAADALINRIYAIG